MKASGDNYNRIYTKEDVHPSVRKDWRRLREVEAAEKEKKQEMLAVIFIWILVSVKCIRITQ